MKIYRKSLFLFHRDLRLSDNTGWNNAVKNSKELFPLFVFEKKQVKSKNFYRSNNALEFMCDSLEDLNKQLEGRLVYIHGNTEEILERVLQEESIEAVFTNIDYTPFAKRRDYQIKKLCKKLKVQFHSYDDALLNSPSSVLKADGRPYSVFTPYYNSAKTKLVARPQKAMKGECVKYRSEALLSVQKNPNIFCRGGRDEGLKILRSLSGLESYEKERDFPFLDKTSKLSAHHKFGTVSIRESFQLIGEALGFNHPLIRQLYWRDFLTQIGFHFPHVFGHSFKEQYDQIEWRDAEGDFLAWCEGKTGFPIVDAGMRQLNKTGWMHNRVRMVVASFLTKDLFIDWRKGECYFAQKLVDYDPCVNNGNWQWAASTGCDAQPYFRIFNPWLQQKRFDLDCQYIKKYVPELKNLAPSEIHQPLLEVSGYPSPICDHKERSIQAKSNFKAILL